MVCPPLPLVSDKQENNAHAQLNSDKPKEEGQDAEETLHTSVLFFRSLRPLARASVGMPRRAVLVNKTLARSAVDTSGPIMARRWFGTKARARVRRVMAKKSGPGRRFRIVGDGQHGRGRLTMIGASDQWNGGMARVSVGKKERMHSRARNGGNVIS